MTNCSSIWIPLYTVDSFSKEAFGGNPAAVCLDTTEQGLSDDQMQKIATEMNISETAFLRSSTGKDESFQTDDRFDLRWFTPTKEVPLCGHGTMASAAALFFCRENPFQEITFSTLSGDLAAERIDDDMISLNMPLNQPAPCQAVLDDLTKLVLPGKADLVREIQYSEATKKLLIRMDDRFTREDLENLEPKVDRLTSCATGTVAVTGVIVTVSGSDRGGRDQDSPRYDFLSRYFAPWNGIPEDPVTARQCSPRGGELQLTMDDSGRLRIAGHATVMTKGQIRVR